LQVKQRTLANQVELTACLIDRVPRSHLLAELTNALPTGVSLLEMDMQSRVRPAPTPAPSAVTTTVTPADAAKAAAAAAAARTPKLYDVYLKVQGVAMTDVQVAAFIAHLGQSAMFKDVNLQVSEEFEVGHQKARRFAIDLQLNPEAKIGGPAISRGSKPSATGPRASTTKGGAS
jgi:Tfp pilus assembly protein PilN